MTVPRASTRASDEDGGRRGTGALLALTGAAAGADAVSYLGLGHVFPANMTGNTVLLAIGIAGSDYSSATRSAIALGGFVVGAGFAGLLTARSKGWTRTMLSVVVAELCFLAAAAAWWLVAGKHPLGGDRLALVALFSLAMGAQSGAVTSLGVGVSTTYITGTWTSVSAWAASRLRAAGSDVPPPPARRPGLLQLVVLVVYFGTALGSGFLFRGAGAFAALVPIAGVLAALGVRRAATAASAARRRW